MIPAPATPLLQAEGLRFQRQDEPVFGPLDFSLQAGEIVLIEGDNGSGKTTLMRLLAGLLRLQEGTLRWRGLPWRRDAVNGQLLLLGHQLGIKSELSAVENLRAATGLYGRRQHRDAAQVLRQVGLAGYEDEPLRRLSAGQRKRVALARLLLLPACLWLLDEPYANLDSEGIALVNRLLAEHAAEGGAALVSGHGAVSFLGGRPRRVSMHG